MRQYEHFKLRFILDKIIVINNIILSYRYQNMLQPLKMALKHTGTI